MKIGGRFREKIMFSFFESLVELSRITYLVLIEMVRTCGPAGHFI